MDIIFPPGVNRAQHESFCRMTSISPAPERTRCRKATVIGSHTFAFVYPSSGQIWNRLSLSPLMGV
ncbi:MAG: hypothetical protein M3Y43_07245, partial [Pseudomonadota bacterium]|nr:hypothetical protein [Pseudomonadota bacterium]